MHKSFLRVVHRKMKASTVILLSTLEDLINSVTIFLNSSGFWTASLIVSALIYRPVSYQHPTKFTPITSVYKEMK